MKIFTNKGLFKKLLIIIIAIMLFSVIIPPKVTYGISASDVGGALLSPIASLMIGLGDVLMDFIHNTLYGTENSLLVICKNSEGLGVLVTVVVALLVIVVVAVLAYVTAGAGVAILGALGVTTTIGAATVGTIITISLVSGLVAGTFVAISWFGDNVVFPMYQISPEEIFRNEVAMLDANFFNPQKYTEKYRTKLDNDILAGSNSYNVAGPVSIFNIGEWWRAMETSPGLKADFIGEKTLTINEALQYDQFKNMIEKVNQDLTSKDKKENVITGDKNFSFKINKKEIIPSNTRTPSFGMTTMVSVTKYIWQFDIIDNESNSTYMVINYVEETKTTQYEYWFSTSVDTAVQSITNYHMDSISYQLIEPNADGTSGVYKKYEELEREIDSTAKQLRPVISKWYYAIRNIVLVVMMIILLYVGIRIIISSVSSEKAKYKTMLLDWVVAICLVFAMHYIMAFASNAADVVIEIFASLGNGDDKYASVYQINGTVKENLTKELNKIGIDIDTLIVKGEDGNPVLVQDNEGNNQEVIYWDAKNLLGMARIQAALCEAGTLTYIGYGIAYLVLVFYTIFFIFTYAKRVLYLAFLTMIAPLVAMTYPIDKMHDGKAQAFNMWLKEYIFNLIIPLVHLLLYTILISSAYELSSTNMTYTLVAIGFMMPAEKFVRKMFGFDKAQTPGFLGGAAGAGLMMAGLGKIFHKRPSKGGKHIEENEGKEKEDKINMKDDSMVDPTLLAEGSNNKSNMSNILSNQEKAKQEQKAKQDMEKARLAAQRANTPASSYINKGGNVGFNKSSDMQKKFDNLGKNKMQEEQKKLAEKRKNGFLRRHARAIKAAGGKYRKMKAIKFGRSLATGKPIRAIAKTAGGLYLGATGAMLGATLGIASGDIGNVGKYGATLGVGGYALGARDIKSSPDVERAYQEFEREKYGSEAEYRKHLLEEHREEVASSDKNLEKLRTYLQLQNQQEAREYMGDYEECIDAGLDMEDMAAVIKAVEEQGWSKEKGITAAKQLNKAGGKPKNMGKKDRENIEYQYRNIFKASGMTNEAEIEENVKMALKSLDTFGKIKDDLTQV